MQVAVALPRIMANKFQNSDQVSASGSGQVGIGITTKDRWPDLEATLAELSDKGFSALETIVIDDGSSRPAPASLLKRFPD